MSEFSDLLGSAFAESRIEMGVDVTHGAVTRRSISSPLRTRQELEDAGYMGEVDVVIDLLTADFVALAIVDRSEITIGGKRVCVMGIDTDDSAPFVTLGCKNAA